MLRHLPVPFVCLACFVGCSVFPARTAAGIEIARVWPGWRDAESFQRIGEYFGGAENTGREIVLRTQPGERAGYYFLVRLAGAVPAGGTKFELRVIHPDTPEPKTYAFAAEVPARGAAFQLGLTGSDWPAGQAAHPVAWKLALLGADGRTLAEHKSFLWEKPRSRGVERLAAARRRAGLCRRRARGDPRWRPGLPVAPPARRHLLGLWSAHGVRLRLAAAGKLEWAAPVAATRETTAAALGAYLGLDRDFAALADTLPWRSDPHLAKGLAAYPGLRILRQPFGETLLGFLCSATKQIVQIKQMLALLAERHGTPIAGTPWRAPARLA